MTTERYVVLGLAQVRSPWFRDLARWATSSSVPVEFVKAVSLEEVRVRLRSGRGYSALLVDDSVGGLDRDLIDAALEAGTAVVLIDSGRAASAWMELGASAVLPHDFERADLVQVLAQVAKPMTRATGVVATIREPDERPTPYQGRLVGVAGAGGTGTSTVAMALAQGLAADPRHAGLVCLADLALDADQAMLHDARDIVPGVLELVEAHRGAAPTRDAVRSLTWRVDERGYQLLLGLRRHRDWTSIRPRALSAALDGLRSAFRVVVADIDSDLEGERATGSVDVEERNVMARSVASAADLVIAVGAPGLRGVHGLLRVTRDLRDHGVSDHRILPIVNRAPRGHRARAEITRAFGELLQASVGPNGVASPIFLTERRGIEETLRDGARLPDAWLAPIREPVLLLLDDAEDGPFHGDLASHLDPAPVLVVPGSLGAWTEQHEPDGRTNGNGG